jgi:hypothetical protein
MFAHGIVAYIIQICQLNFFKPNHIVAFNFKNQSYCFLNTVLQFLFQIIPKALIFIVQLKK